MTEAEQERAAIVAYLHRLSIASLTTRSGASYKTRVEGSETLKILADAIEAGDHLKGEK